MTEMTMVRIYLTEKEYSLDKLVKYLHDDAKVAGVTVFKGTEGFGHSGKMHESSLVDLSFDLPITVEFFDENSKVNEALLGLKQLVEPRHMVSWPVNAL